MKEIIKMQSKKMGIFLMAGILGFGSMPSEMVVAKPSEEREIIIRQALLPVENIVNQKYYKKVDTETLKNTVIEEVDDETPLDAILKKFVGSIGDPYAEYFTEEELRSFNKGMEGKFYGIGVQVNKDEKTGGSLINRVFDKSPAKEAGLKAGDIIIEVAEKTVTEMELQDVIKLIKGESGTQVKITILRGKKKKSFMVERREVVLPSVDNKYYSKQKIGYIQVSGFLDHTDEEFDEQLSKLEEKKLKGLIIDLRDNGGGYVDTAMNMLERILPKGKKVFSFLHSGGQTEDYFVDANTSEEEDKVFKKPIVILMNKKSASASEIFAGGLKDNEAAKVVGEKSFGKGVAQSIFRANSDEARGAVKVTVHYYLLPMGENIHGIGITPNKIVENKKDKKGKLQDHQLKAAIKLLRKRK